MDFKTGSFACFLVLSMHLALAARNDTYACLDPSQCAGDSYALYVVVGNLTLCCNAGDFILFTAQSDDFYYARGGYLHLDRNDTMMKRSAEEPAANRTISYGCMCTTVDVEDVRPEGVDGSFAISLKYLRRQLARGRQILRFLMRTYVME